MFREGNGGLLINTSMMYTNVFILKLQVIYCSLYNVGSVLYSNKKNSKLNPFFFILIFFFFLQGLSFGTVDKILLKFPYKWWPDGFTVYSVLKTNETAQCTVEVRNETSP
jgi:hypothetical protein